MSSVRNSINITNKYDRVVLLVDMDCFYCQVEEKLDPRLAGKPLAVVQYNAWRGGGIIAVNYAARAKGVTRYMRGDEAKDQCPEIELAKVPNVREKADLTKYRDAGKEVANVLQKFTSLLERASVDEAYLDITAEVNKRMENMNAGTFLLEPEKLTNTHAVGYENIGDYISEITSKISNPCDDDEYSLTYDVDDAPAVRKSDLRLLLGAAIASEIRAAVKKETKYECSAGIAHNKILAKLACGMNKPNKQTILPLSQITQLFSTLPVGKITGLGAKYGEEICERLKVKFLGDLVRFSKAELQRKLDEKNGYWVYLICRGIDLEAVTPRFYSKSIGCCKKFPGRNSITGLKTLEHWLTELATEIADRLDKDIEENNRRAKQMVVSYIQEINSEDISSSRSASLPNYEPECIQKCALDVLKRNTDQFLKSGSDLALNNPIKFLGISVGKFESITSGAQNTLQQMFANQKKKEPTSSTATLDKTEEVDSSPVVSKASALEKMFAIQKEKKPVAASEPQLIPEENNNSKPLKSFFAAHLNRIKQQHSIEVAGPEVDSDNLFCEETIADLSSVETSKSPTVSSFANETLLKENSSLNQSNNSFFAHTLKSHSSVLESPAPSASRKRKSSSPGGSDLTLLETTLQSEYPELATPELREEFFTKCEICGQKVLSDEKSLQSHNDRHMAEELSRQQREEYRKEIQVKISQNSQQKKPSASINTNKKAKPNSPNVAIDIKKFMQPFTQPSQPSTSAQITCEKCGRCMHRDLMPEHLDYHYARDLQLSLNRSEMVTVVGGSSLSKNIKSPSSAKKTTSTSVVSAIKSKPITQFFSQM